MTPHEVVKNSLEKFEKEYDFINDEDEYTLDKYDVESFIEHLKSSQLSLLLSVKEIVEDVEKTVQKELETWARESIGAKAVESVQKALADIITKLSEEK